jgi:hypothetical protein
VVQTVDAESKQPEGLLWGNLLEDIFEDRDQGVRIILKYMLREQVSAM